MDKKVYDFVDRCGQSVQLAVYGEVLVEHVSPAEVVMTLTAVAVGMWLVWLSAFVS